MDDITQRLRLSPSPDEVERERYMAANMYGDAMRNQDERVSPEKMRHLAKQSIAAACTFWEEWEIAVLTPDIAVKDDHADVLDVTGLA